MVTVEKSSEGAKKRVELSEWAHERMRESAGLGLG